MKIDVTADDIANGEAHVSCSCPVALALCRHCPGHKFEVTAGRIQVDGCGRIVTPLAVSDFVWRFDTDQSVEPFSFEIDGPGL